MKAYIKCLGRTKVLQLPDECNNETILSKLIDRLISQSMIYTQLKGIIRIKLNTDYEFYRDKDVIYVFCKVHSITYNVGNGYGSIKLVEQDYDSLIKLLRQIINRIKSDFYKEQLLRKILNIKLI